MKRQEPEDEEVLSMRQWLLLQGAKQALESISL